jgi:hypothetical protein
MDYPLGSGLSISYSGLGDYLLGSGLSISYSGLVDYPLAVVDYPLSLITQLTSIIKLYIYILTTERLAEIMGCKTTQLPMNYLGLPLGVKFKSKAI